MRKWVDKYLTDLAKEDSSIRLLIADVGDFPIFQHAFPDKFINVGVSESNCIGVAAGLAACNFRVFVYGVSSFFLYRAFEQFKYSISYWKKPITFIGVGFGWKYYNIGKGHFTPDDIALFRLLPGFRIKTPFTLTQLRQEIFSSSINYPSYLRITSSIIEDLPNLFYNGNYLIVSYGEMCKISLQVWQELDNDEFNLYLMRNLDNETIKDLTIKAQNKKIITIEDQNQIGSLADILSNIGMTPLLKFMLPLYPDYIAKTRDNLLKLYGLDPNSILSKIHNILI